jgi:hypothetical protein
MRWRRAAGVCAIFCGCEGNARFPGGRCCCMLLLRVRVLARPPPRARLFSAYARVCREWWARKCVGRRNEHTYIFNTTLCDSRIWTLDRRADSWRRSDTFRLEWRRRAPVRAAWRGGWGTVPSDRGVIALRGETRAKIDIAYRGGDRSVGGREGRVPASYFSQTARSGRSRWRC